MLLVQPEDGIAPLVAAIAGARRSVDLCVFRLNHPPLEEAIGEARARSVRFRVLLAHSNGSGKAALAKVESRLTHLGCDVRRSADDLDRYHGKMLLVDRARLYVTGFNLTRRDIDRSRSLGLMTARPRAVQEAMRLFEADFEQAAYVPEHGPLVVSPYNSRAVLGRLLQGARRQLLVYDARLTDPLMLALLGKKAAAGVEVRVLGRLGRDVPGVTVAPPPGRRQHLRAIVQDGARLFVGSQSLRRLELDKRREIGLVVSDRADVARAIEVFESDWSKTGRASTRRPAVARNPEQRSPARAVRG